MMQAMYEEEMTLVTFSLVASFQVRNSTFLELGRIDTNGRLLIVVFMDCVVLLKCFFLPESFIREEK